MPTVTCPQCKHTFSPVNRIRRPRTPATVPQQAQEAAATLWSFISARNTKFPTPDLDTWAGDMDKIVRLDGYSWKDVDDVIRWCQADSFWQNNILSGAKLRKQMSQLIMKMPKDTAYKGAF